MQRTYVVSCQLSVVSFFKHGTVPLIPGTVPVVIQLYSLTDYSFQQRLLLACTRDQKLLQPLRK